MSFSHYPSKFKRTQVTTRCQANNDDFKIQRGEDIYKHNIKIESDNMILQINETFQIKNGADNNAKSFE